MTKQLLDSKFPMLMKIEVHYSACRILVVCVALTHCYKFYLTSCHYFDV